MRPKTARLLIGATAVAAGTLGLAAPAHAAAPTVSLSCESTNPFNCDATISGSLGELQWYLNGGLVTKFTNDFVLILPCPSGHIYDMSVVYTDPTGAQATSAPRVVQCPTGVGD